MLQWLLRMNMVPTRAYRHTEDLNLAQKNTQCVKLRDDGIDFLLGKSNKRPGHAMSSQEAMMHLVHNTLQPKRLTNMMFRHLNNPQTNAMKLAVNIFAICGCHGHHNTIPITSDICASVPFHGHEQLSRANKMLSQRYSPTHPSECQRIEDCVLLTHHAPGTHESREQCLSLRHLVLASQ